MVDREEVADLLGRFHRNSCYPEAMDGELFAYADQIIALFPAQTLTRISIPTETMEQEFQAHYRRGYEAGKSASAQRPACVHTACDDPEWCAGEPRCRYAQQHEPRCSECGSVGDYFCAGCFRPVSAIPVASTNPTQKQDDDFYREALSTVGMMLGAFEQVQDEAPWFQKAFEKGKSFLARHSVASTNCPNCNGSKRAEYFSEQSWSYEWRTCHKCDVASTDRPGTTECDHCRGTGRVNVNPFAPDNTMVSEILAADAAPQEASHNNAEDMLRWLNDEPVARPNRPPSDD